MQHLQPVHPDILVISENKKGDDHIIGDLHGNFALLDTVLNSLNPDDRLFIVGDLVDRGKDSLGVVLKIIEFQIKHPGKLFVIKGNHEDMCLQAIAALKKLLLYAVSTKLPNLLEYIANNNLRLEEIMRSHPSIYEIIFLVKYIQGNGGKWLIDLFAKK